LTALRARSIGPAVGSGRVVDIEVVEVDPRVVFVALGSGGVWKSTDHGTTWRPIFDEQPTLSIGALALYQPNPNLVWVGTGEGHPRFDLGIGTGIYKSEDAGETWACMGLERSERIYRVLIHPTNPDIVYAAVIGPQWSDGEERGVYKTTDGGQTWRRLLFVNPRTGCSDLSMDPSNPDRLLAAMYEFRRHPWWMDNGGPSGGIYLSEDGGETWQERTEEHGVPAGEKQRIGLAFAPSDGCVAYALFGTRTEPDMLGQGALDGPGYLLRSNDGGRSWTVVDSPAPVLEHYNRAGDYAYSEVVVHPNDPERIYVPMGGIYESLDGGRTFGTSLHNLRPRNRQVHGDFHPIWIHPSQPLMWAGSDGGAYVSYNEGQTWRYMEALPGAECYAVAVDDETPYHVYTGLLDAFSWRGPSQVWEYASRYLAEPAIKDHHWISVGTSDGYHTPPIPGTGGRYGYNMMERGTLARFDALTGCYKNVQPPQPDDGSRLRFNYNLVGTAVSPFDPDTLYFGSQFVHKTADRGETWETISPDLTVNPPELREFRHYMTITEIAPSPVERGLLWAGTGEGGLWVTRDEGGSWERLTDRLPGVPKDAYVASIKASPHDPAVAFVAVSDYQRGDFTPYLYKTSDYGRTWERLGADLPSYLWKIEQDPVEPNLLFAGHQFGFTVSFDGGSSWLPWEHGLPAVPVRGLVVQPREHDLVVGTFGRGIYILDDIRPLRELATNPGITERALHLFSPPPATQAWIGFRRGAACPGDSPYQGENRPRGALISYWLGHEAGSSDVHIEIRDRADEVVRTFTGSANPGLNRVVWDLRYQSVMTPDGPVNGADIIPGSYQVTVHAGDIHATGTIQVLPDPRLAIPQAERDAWLSVAKQLTRSLERASTAARQVAALQAGLGEDHGQAAGQSGEIKARLTGLADRLAGIIEDLSWYLADDERYGGVSSSWERPSAGVMTWLSRSEDDLEAAVAELNELNGR
jgi:photosystem II stability/assembly factor-like uncharacterized protein